MKPFCVTTRDEVLPGCFLCWCRLCPYLVLKRTWHILQIQVLFTLWHLNLANMRHIKKFFSVLTIFQWSFFTCRSRLNLQLNVLSQISHITLSLSFFVADFTCLSLQLPRWRCRLNFFPKQAPHKWHWFDTIVSVSFGATTFGPFEDISLADTSKTSSCSSALCALRS